MKFFDLRVPKRVQLVRLEVSVFIQIAVVISIRNFLTTNSSQIRLPIFAVVIVVFGPRGIDVN